jgi:hypothetical protein
MDRRPPYQGVLGFPDSMALGSMSFITKYPERQASWDEWEAFLVQSQKRFDALPEDLKADLERTGAMASLKLQVPPGQPIDGTVFACIMNNRLPLELPSIVKHDLKKRLFHVGSALMKMHNCLIRPGIYQGLALLLRKCVIRLKYVLKDAIKNETNLADLSGNVALAKAAAEAEVALAARRAAEAAADQAQLDSMTLDATLDAVSAEEVTEAAAALAVED